MNARQTGWTDDAGDTRLVAGTAPTLLLETDSGTVSLEEEP
jgi:hypothetical protein